MMPVHWTCWLGTVVGAGCLGWGIKGLVLGPVMDDKRREVERLTSKIAMLSKLANQPPEVRTVEKRVEVPVERVVVKHVEVPVEKIIEKRVEVPVISQPVVGNQSNASFAATRMALASTSCTRISGTDAPLVTPIVPTPSSHAGSSPCASPYATLDAV